MLARIEARAASLRSQEAAAWQTVVREAPPLAAFAGALKMACGERVNAVVHNGIRYGNAPLERIVPPIPGARGT